MSFGFCHAHSNRIAYFQCLRRCNFHLAPCKWMWIPWPIQRCTYGVIYCCLPLPKAPKLKLGFLAVPIGESYFKTEFCHEAAAGNSACWSHGKTPVFGQKITTKFTLAICSALLAKIANACNGFVSPIMAWEPYFAHDRETRRNSACADGKNSTPSRGGLPTGGTHR